MPSIWAIIAIRICNNMDICRECFFCMNKWHCESGKKPELNLCDGFLHPGSLDYCCVVLFCFLKKTVQGIWVIMKYISFFFLSRHPQNWLPVRVRVGILKIYAIFSFLKL